MHASDAEQRNKEILGAIIEAYIATASPVGSELISRKLRHSLSPATVRNIMADFEEEGYLEQPHISAGRVPTDRGYRYYVDSLMDMRRLSAEEARQLAEAIGASEPELGQCFARVSEALAHVSHQTVCVVAPTVKRSTIRQIELLPLSLHKLLCVLVGQEPLVASHVIDVEEPINHDEVLLLAHFLNTELVGLPARELLVSLERRLLSVSDSFYYLVKRSLDILQTALATEPEERLFIEGVTNLFAQPEFRKDPHKAERVFQHLESGHELLERMREDLVHEATSIRIGHELELEGFEDCSYVFAPFTLRQAAAGGVGILGPKRMDYRRMRALVEEAAALITDLVARLEL